MPQVSFISQRTCTHVGEPHPPGTCPSKHRLASCCPHKIPRRLSNAEWLRGHRERVRAEVIAVYGGQCACCAEATSRFLTIDHKNGDGAEHRRSLPKGRKTDMYRWAKANGYPDDLQLLCFNCNYARSYYGRCH
jgi:hypothetical protein